MLLIGWIFLHTLNGGVKHSDLGPGTETFTTGDSKAGVWWLFYRMNSNLSHVSKTYNLDVKKGFELSRIIVPAHDSIIGWDDHFMEQISISISSEHSAYYWCDIGRVKLMWNAWINPNMLHLGLNCLIGARNEIGTTCDSKVRVWWWLYLYMMNSNLSHVAMLSDLL